MKRYPVVLGFGGSGTVVAVGSEVKTIKIGDEVYGLGVEKPMFRGTPPTFAAQYTVIKEKLVIPKPKDLSWEAAASLPGFVVTAIQVIRRGLQKRGEDSLEGKTVYIPAALSGTGSVMIQVAKNVFGASKIISTVSTPKVPLVKEYLPGMVDQVIDYKKQRVQDVVPRGSVDFVVNTQWGTLTDGIALLNPENGTLMSITSLPSKEAARGILGDDKFPWWFGVLLDIVQLYYRWLTRGTKLEHEVVSGSPDVREDLEAAGEVIALGKVKPVMRVVDFEDIEAVRKNAEQVYTGKGGLGKLVVRVA
jgi:NADPH:quinone reductase-like Zn-dependent oxidoreductase